MSRETFKDCENYSGAIRGDSPRDRNGLCGSPADHRRFTLDTAEATDEQDTAVTETALGTDASSECVVVVVGRSASPYELNPLPSDAWGPPTRGQSNREANLAHQLLSRKCPETAFRLDFTARALKTGEFKSMTRIFAATHRAMPSVGPRWTELRWKFFYSAICFSLQMT